MMPGAGRHRARETSFRLLFVCTGNICRSPFAEILMRHLLAERLGRPAAASFEVASAGVHGVEGAPIHPDTRAELGPFGIDGEPADHFTARRLASAMVESSDLVLGANPSHRAAVVDSTPDALPFVFSLREFARLAVAVDPRGLPSVPVERAHALVEAARSRRGLVPPAPDGDRIPDPMGHPAAAHHAAAVLIREALAVIVGALGAPGVTSRV